MILKSLRKTFLIFLMLGIGTLMVSAQISVSGTVVDESGEALPGVNILEMGTNNGVVSDVNGNYTIKVNDPNGTIVFSYLGYLKEEVVIDNRTSINITLVSDIKALEEVVIIGYGTIKKSDLTGAVSTVKSEELSQLSTVNVQQALQGRASGVTITSESGEPGAGTKVRIRGVGTINNSDPLYVVDGFPTTDISYISPNDIQSVEILKDASATAIYGNRGANGVVMITTKAGKAQKATLSFSMFTGAQQAAKKIDVLDATGYAKAKILSKQNADGYKGIAMSDAQDTLFNYIIDNNLKGTDWQDEIMQRGAVQNYSIGLNGGSEKVNYDLSATYYSEDGLIQNSWLRKYFFRSNTQYKLSDKFTVTSNLSYVHSQKTNYDFGIYSSPLTQALTAEPITPVWNTETDYYHYLDISERTNPVAAVERMKNNQNKFNKFVGNFSLDYTIIPGLVISSKFGADYTFNENFNYTPKYSIGTKDQNLISNLYQRRGTSFGWNWSNFVNYTKDFNKHSLNLMLGQEASYGTFANTDLTVFGVPNKSYLMTPTAASNIKSPIVNSVPNNPWSRFEEETAIMSIFGRFNYSYDSKYLLTASIRRDGSSKINPDTRWGTFPSFSVGWNMKRESFLADVDFVNTLKLRGGYGITGNERSVSDPYVYWARAKMTSTTNSNGTTSNQTNKIAGNSDLQWELTKQMNGGFDFGVLNNRINGSIDYFIRKTEDMIVTPPYFSQRGDLPPTNIGSMENKGLELSLSYRNFDGDFKYEIGGNITFLSHPLVTKLAEEGQVIRSGTAGKVSNIVRTEAGKELAYFYGYKTDGVYKATDSMPYINGYTLGFQEGDLKIVDQDNNDTIDERDKIDLGSANPDFTYGFNLNFMYKGFDLKVFMQGVYGNEMVNGLNAWLSVPIEGNDNMLTSVLDGYQPGVNENSDIPRLVEGGDGNPVMKEMSSFYLENASYFRIKNIQLGYTLPENISSKFGSSNLRVYVSAENLFTFTKYSGYDPEQSRGSDSNDATTQGIDQATYPLGKRFLVGLNVTF